MQVEALEGRTLLSGETIATAELLNVQPNQRLTVTEGVYTASAVVELAAARGIDMPIAQAVQAVVSGLATVDEAIEALLARPLRAEV